MRAKEREHLSIDLGTDSIKLRSKEAVARIPLSRYDDGGFTEESVEAVRRTVEKMTGKRNVGRRGKARPAWCALPARGVSLRRWQLPDVSVDERERMLALRVETEFPLPIEQMVWGHASYPTSTNGSTPPNAAGHREVLVAALRADGVRPYRELLEASGLAPRFTLGILEAGRICPRVPGLAAVLDVGAAGSDLLFLRDGRPCAIRSLALGGEQLTRDIAEALGVSAEEARSRERSQESLADAEREEVKAAVGRLASRIADWVHDCSRELPQDAGGLSHVFLVGGGARAAGFPSALESALSGVTCERITAVKKADGSAVLSGLRKRLAQRGESDIELRVPQCVESSASRSVDVAAVRRWAAIALLLFVATVVMAYARPIWKLAALEQRIAQMRTELDLLPSRERELGFLQTLQARRVPYFDIVTAIGTLAPPGTHLDTVSLDRTGDVAFRCRVPKNELVNPYRERLATSGWFRDLVLEEQTASKDKKMPGIIVRISAQLAFEPGRVPDLPEPFDAAKAKKEAEARAAAEKARKKEAKPPTPTKPAVEEGGKVLSAKSTSEAPAP